MRHARPLVATAVLCGALSLSMTSTSSAKPPAAAPQCGQRGRVVFDQRALLLNADGRRIARFSGGESAVTFVAPPVEGSELAHIETGTGRGSFRIPGFVKASELRLYAAQPLPVVSGHVWVGSGARVVVAGSAQGLVRVERQLDSPFAQRVSATVDCSALTFTPPPLRVPAHPGGTRVFLLKEPRLELFDSMPPTSPAVFTLVRASGAGSARLFSREQRGGYVHVQYEGDIVLDAWARASDLQPLPRGETSDVPAGSYLVTDPPRLTLSELPRVVKTTREIPLRLAARDSESPIGVIEPETEVYVMDVIASWTKVLPKSLHVLPDGDGAFWAKSSDLGL